MKTRQGKVVGLTRQREKGAPRETLTEVRLVEGLGLEGEQHSSEKRQLSLFSAEARRWMDEQTEPGLCFRRFQENLLLEGIPLEDCAVGDLLSIGEVRLRISQTKRCFEECVRFSQKLDCHLARCAVFAAVEAGGIIRLEDGVRCE